MLETNIDDMNPEIFSYLMPKLFEAGALDVFYTQIMMKKNRPGTKINVLCEETQVKDLEDILFTETSTLGIRQYSLERSKLERDYLTVWTKYGEITIKIAYKQDEMIKYAPEYEDCKKAAEVFEVPIRVVYQEAVKEAEGTIED